MGQTLGQFVRRYHHVELEFRVHVSPTLNACLGRIFMIVSSFSACVVSCLQHVTPWIALPCFYMKPPTCMITSTSLNVWYMEVDSLLSPLLFSVSYSETASPPPCPAVLHLEYLPIATVKKNGCSSSHSLHATPSALTDSGHIASPGSYKLAQYLRQFALPSHASWIDNVNHHVTQQFLFQSDLDVMAG